MFATAVAVVEEGQVVLSLLVRIYIVVLTQLLLVVVAQVIILALQPAVMD